MNDIRILRGGVMYKNRRQAGRLLGEALLRAGRKLDVVLGLTRGGVPIAFEVVSTLAIPLDILVVKKLRAPMSEELAIGAICADGTRMVHKSTVQQPGVDEDYLSYESRKRLAEAQEVEKMYRKGQAVVDLDEAYVVIVDDGIATGSTMEAAMMYARNRKAKRVTVATPVGSAESCNALRRMADEVFCLETPEDFWTVGQFYSDFTPVSDQEVQKLLALNRSEKRRAPL